MNYRNRFIQSPPSSPSMNPFMNPRSKSMYWQGSGQQPKCLSLSTGGIQRHDQTDQTASPSTGGIYQRGRTAALQILAEFEQGLVELGCIFAARDPELSTPPPGAQDYRRAAPPNRAGGRDCRAEPAEPFPFCFAWCSRGQPCDPKASCSSPSFACLRRWAALLDLVLSWLIFLSSDLLIYPSLYSRKACLSFTPAALVLVESHGALMLRPH